MTDSGNRSFCPVAPRPANSYLVFPGKCSASKPAFLSRRAAPFSDHPTDVAKERKGRRFIVANPDEPGTGDFGFSFYDKSHPMHGDPETIAHLKRGLRGLRGERVTVWFNGAHINADGESKRFRLRRTFNFRAYTDVFGPGSAYGSIIHFIRDTYSDETLVTYSISFDIAEEDDEDDEDRL